MRSLSGSVCAITWIASVASSVGTGLASGAQSASTQWASVFPALVAVIAAGSEIVSAGS